MIHFNNQSHTINKDTWSWHIFLSSKEISWLIHLQITKNLRWKIYLRYCTIYTILSIVQKIIDSWDNFKETELFWMSLRMHFLFFFKLQTHLFYIFFIIKVSFVKSLLVCWILKGCSINVDLCQTWLSPTNMHKITLYVEEEKQFKNQSHFLKRQMVLCIN